MADSNAGFYNSDMARYSALTAVLLKKGVAFDTKYSPSDGRDSASLVVTVYISPKVSVDYSFSDLDLTQMP